MRTRCVQHKADKASSAKPEAFGDLITADHVVFGERDASHDAKRVVLTCYDRYSGGIEAIPCPRKTTHSTTLALKDFAGSTTPKLFYSDNSGELVEAAKTLRWLHDTSTENRSATNGVIERQNRNMLEGLRSREDTISTHGRPGGFTEAERRTAYG